MWEINLFESFHAFQETMKSSKISYSLVFAQYLPGNPLRLANVIGENGPKISEDSQEIEIRPLLYIRIGFKLFVCQTRTKNPATTSYGAGGRNLSFMIIEFETGFKFPNGRTA